jgi:nitrate reductase NapAB chaperone NapD
MTDVGWSVSGLCITARPERMAALEDLLNARPGLEVYARDQQSGRLVAVQECATVEEHRQKLRELQTLPGVLTAELVLHYRDSVDGEPPTTTGARE